MRTKFNLPPLTRAGCALRADPALLPGHLPKYSFTGWVALIYFKKWKLKSILLFVTETTKEDVQSNPDQECTGGKGKE